MDRTANDLLREKQHQSKQCGDLFDTKDRDAEESHPINIAPHQFLINAFIKKGTSMPRKANNNLHT